MYGNNEDHIQIRHQSNKYNTNNIGHKLYTISALKCSQNSERKLWKITFKYNDISLIIFTNSALNSPRNWQKYPPQIIIRFISNKYIQINTIYHCHYFALLILDRLTWDLIIFYWKIWQKRWQSNYYSVLTFIWLSIKGGIEETKFRSHM